MYKLEGVIKKENNEGRGGSRDIYQLNARWSQYPFDCLALFLGRGGGGGAWQQGVLYFYGLLAP